jgi:UDP-glucose 4-epimerase
MLPMNDSDNSPQRKKALVTGAGGFIGSHLCAGLVSRNYAVTALVRSTNNSEHSGVDEICIADVCEASSLGSAFIGADTVFHLAGAAHANARDYNAMRRLNVMGTENVLRAAIAANVRRLVYLSSSLVQACETGVGDITDYGQSKLEAEQLLMSAHANQQLEVAILRPVNVYGAGMKGNIASMISLIARRRLPPLPRLRNELSLVSVDDLVNALVLVAESPSASGNSYYVTDGETYRVNDIERAIYKVLGRNRPGWYSPRVVLYAASVLACLVGKLKAGGTSISARTYYNLVNDNCFSSQQIQDDLGFLPSGNLYKEMPALVEHLVK